MALCGIHRPRSVFEQYVQLATLDFFDMAVRGRLYNVSAAYSLFFQHARPNQTLPLANNELRPP